EGMAAIDLQPPAAALSAPALRSGLRWFARLKSTIAAAEARWLTELDRKQAAAAAASADPDPEGSCLQWLHDTLHLTPGAAYGQLRTARQLHSRPLVAGSLRRGEISAQQASVICQAVEQAAK